MLKERHSILCKLEYHMTNRTEIYKKVGRRYVEIGNYDPERYFNPIGFHLMQVEKGCTTTTFNVNPDKVGLMAALISKSDRVMELLASFQTPTSDAGGTKWYKSRYQMLTELYKLLEESDSDESRL
jgi:hypothetical protein